jgi:hypothetical protein
MLPQIGFDPMYIYIGCALAVVIGIGRLLLSWAD